ncbi:hypothetical protein ACQEU6_02500 [Spirillospora sp. CA-108201]
MADAAHSGDLESGSPVLTLPSILRALLGLATAAAVVAIGFAHWSMVDAGGARLAASDA